MPPEEPKTENTNPEQWDEFTSEDELTNGKEDEEDD